MVLHSPTPIPMRKQGLRAGVTDGLKKHLGHQVKASVLKYLQVCAWSRRGQEGAKAGGGRLWQWAPSQTQDASAAAPCSASAKPAEGSNLAEGGEQTRRINVTMYARLRKPLRGPPWWSQ